MAFKISRCSETCHNNLSIKFAINGAVTAYFPNIKYPNIDMYKLYDEVPDESIPTFNIIQPLESDVINHSNEPIYKKRFNVILFRGG